MNREIDVRHVLPSIRVATLVLHGMQDAIVPLDAARWMAERIPAPGSSRFPPRAVCTSVAARLP